MMESRSRSVLDTPLSRSMTIFARSGLSRRNSTSEGGSDEAIHTFSLGIAERDEIDRRRYGTLMRSQPARS
jgi:hypothetical protein